MRKTTFITLLVVFGCVALACSTHNAKSIESQNSKSPESQKNESPEALIRRLYDNHLKENVIPSKDSNSQAYQKILADYFDEELTGLLVEDDKCASKEQEPCKLDYDPIIASQDSDNNEISQTLKIRKTESSPNSPSYEVTFRNLQDSVGTTKLIYRLRQTDHGWRISDIIDTRDGEFSLKGHLRE
jgi:hypothetical protein